MKNKKKGFKIGLVFLLSLLFYGFGSFLSSKALAYNCLTQTPTMYCMAPVGGVISGVYIKSYDIDPWSGQMYDICAYLSYTYRYSCSGTDSACNGGRSYYTDSGCTYCSYCNCSSCFAGCCSTNSTYKDVTCSCSWNTGVCGGGTCDDDERYQTKTCNVSSCSGHGDTRCEYSSTCCVGCSCTPTCAADGFLDSCTGPGCADEVADCINKDSCGVACGGTTTKACFSCTPPAAPATPTSVSLRVNTTNYSLSTNSSSPTIIDYRTGGTIKVFSNSTTTNYKYDVYNAYSGGTSLLNYSGTTQVQPASGSLAYSPIGRFEASHYNFKCPDNSRNYSGTRIGYYCMERNVKPPTTPTGMNMTIDGQVYSLSTSAVDPKVVKYPTTDATKTNTKLNVLPTRSTPTTASASGYRVEANNYGLGEWMDFSCARGEDFCNEGTSNEYNFSPNTEALLDVLREGAEGKVDGEYYDVNECDTTKVYSDPEDFYYRVNNNPDFGCPNIVNDGDDQISSRDCVSATHTGVEVNNPLKFEIIGSDLDGVDEIKGAIVWLSKNGTISQIPDFPTIAGTYTRSDPNHVAVMILQRDGSWANSPLLYAPDSANGYNWGNITSSRQITTTAGTMAT
ncbi:MAG: hypothetical protein WCY37_03270, partial [Candidatus Dojkabacteria bacterium]